MLKEHKISPKDLPGAFAIQKGLIGIYTYMKSKEDLIYDLIFSKETDYQIEISDYIPDIYKWDRFVDDLKEILKKSKVKIIREKLDFTPTTATWILKVKK